MYYEIVIYKCRIDACELKLNEKKYSKKVMKDFQVCCTYKYNYYYKLYY